MTEIFYCKKLVNDLNVFNHGHHNDAIRKSISIFLHRDNLKSIGKISAKKDNFYFFRLSDYNCNIIIEKQTIEVQGGKVNVHFLQELIQDKALNGEQGRIFHAKYLNSNWLIQQRTSKKDIAKFKEEYSAKNKVFKKKPPSTTMTSWFDDFKLKLKNNVFESRVWVEYSLNQNIENGLNDYHIYSFRKLIQKVLNTETEYDTFLTINDVEIYESKEDNVAIIYSIFDTGDTTYFLLHFGAHIPTQSDYYEKEKNELQRSTLVLANTRENLSRNSFRSYPSWTLSSDETWYPIQKSDEFSNLSLTDEQSKFLTNFKFPHYISGQAGSGKSTLLYYIYANVLYLKNLSTDQIGDVIFLTENKKLLEGTKEYVYDLLKNNPEFGIEDELENINSDEYFNYFQNFLLNILDPLERALFPVNKFLNFSRFKEEYKNSNIKKSIKTALSAEEAWFTIITFIYGYQSGCVITSKTYTNKVSQKSRTAISEETFIAIEKHILPLYNSLIAEGYWGKLELIRYINENMDYKSLKKYTVIICDEAQDFCKVEIEFILKMSKYLEYDLSRTQQVPVLFAGDPNQTVNPTGFREDEMTSILHVQLKEIGGYQTDSKISYSPKLNYRSSHPVVNLANIIQYYRIKNLDVRQQFPQEAKRPINNEHQEFNIFIASEDIEGDTQLKENLLKKIKYKVFIVPGDELEKDEIKNNSPLLSCIDDLEIKTSVEAKGAEYKQVVIIGFGDYFIKHFGTPNNCFTEQTKFRVDYFFNKLYVAITRAQNELLIIDSIQAKSSFWKDIVTNTTISQTSNWHPLKQKLNDAILYDTSSVNLLIKVSTKDDALANAEQDKKEGINHENSARLKVAAHQFFKLGNKKESCVCLAYSEFFKLNYKASADYFLKADESSLAANSFFQGAHFKELESLGIGTSDTSNKLRLLFAKIMNSISVSTDNLSFMMKNKYESKELLRDTFWRSEFLEKLIDNTKKSISQETKEFYVKILSNLAVSSDKKLYKFIAESYYNAKEYQYAISAWEKLGEHYNLLQYNDAQFLLAKENYDTDAMALWADALCYFYTDKENIIDKYSNLILKLYREEKLDLSNKFILNAIYNAYFYGNSIENTQKFGKFYETKIDTANTILNFYQYILEKSNLRKPFYIFALERFAKKKWLSSFHDEDNSLLEEINTYNKEVSDLRKIPYKSFTAKELDEIPDRPQEIQDRMNIHLTKIKVSNFRKYKHIELNNLGQINLIVGDNNVGKTSILEALLISGNSKESIRNLYFAYIARENSNRYIKDNDEFYNVPHNFMSSFNKIDEPRKNIVLVLEKNRNIEEIQINMGEESDKLNVFGQTDESNHIDFTVNNIKKELNMDDIAIKANTMIHSQLIPFSKGFDKGFVLMYEKLIGRFKSKQIEFVNAMKVFIPDIEYIKIDTYNNLVLIEEKDIESPSSITHFGEGANKLFRILVQIAIQEGKKLLIDEIDAGIHYSHYLNFWKTIIKTSNFYNVQLFVTTHNIECLEYLKKALQEDSIAEYKKTTRLITLINHSDGVVVAYTREYDEFEFAIKKGMELRGGN